MPWTLGFYLLAMVAVYQLFRLVDVLKAIHGCLLVLARKARPDIYED